MQMASVSHILGVVILIMTVVMPLMKPIVVSVFYFISVVWLSLAVVYGSQVMYSGIPIFLTDNGNEILFLKSV